MHVDAIEVVNFRNLVDGRIEFGSGVNWLVGQNGAGKTNCLEAVYFSLTTKSFRTHRLSHLIRDRSLETKIQTDLQRQGRPWRVSVVFKPGQCQRWIGQQEAKPMDLFKLTSVIAFTARSKLLVEGQPEDRRRFLDRMITYLDPNHISLLGRYKKVQLQLKKELLAGGNLQVYKGFKKIAAPVAERLTSERKRFISIIIKRAQELYTTIFEGKGELSLRYLTRGRDKNKPYESKYLDVSAQELLHKRSAMGPHLDDLQIEIMANRARHFASSGQVRAIVLSVKLAVREAYKERFGDYPLLLLDDIDAELDSSRLERLLDYLEGRGSTLITTSKYDTISGRPKDGLHELVAGRVTSKRKSE